MSKAVVRSPSKAVGVPAPPATEQNIMSCQGVVRSIAWQIHQKIGRRGDLDELIAYGQVGLAEAARDFDASRGNRFITFAYHRIRGAILDGLSQMAWFSRRDYPRNRYHSLAQDVIDEEAGEFAKGEDQAAWFGRVTVSLTLTRLAMTDDDEFSAMHGASEPSVASMARETKRILGQLVDALPADASTMIRLIYFEDVSLTDAATQLGISKSWASRLHARVLRQLGEALRSAGAVG